MEEGELTQEHLCSVQTCPLPENLEALATDTLYCLIMEQANRVDRTYAHFHRVLGELLTELSALPGVLWLSDKQQHVLRGEGERNTYARAVYRVSSLEPYRERLAELTGVQQQGVAELGLGRVPRELLLPQVVENVTHVRLSEIPVYRTTPVAKEKVLAKIDTALTTTKKNLAEFQRYGTRDDGVKRLGAEVEAIETVRKTVVQAQEDLYRLRVKQVRYRPYVYLLGEKPQQVDSRTHGLILVGPDIGVSYPNTVRQTRSDQRTLKPLFEFGKTRIYYERVWQEAGK